MQSRTLVLACRNRGLEFVQRTPSDYCHFGPTTWHSWHILAHSASARGAGFMTALVIAAQFEFPHSVVAA